MRMAAFTIVDRFGRRRWLRRLKRRSDAREFGGAAGVRQEAKMADAAEPLRQDVEQKATNELLSVERHHFGFVAGAIILAPEADVALLTGEKPAVGDRNAMGVAPEIRQNLFWSAEGTAWRRRPLRQEKSWKGEWKCNLKPFEAILRVRPPSRYRRSPPAGSESCMGDGDVAREA